MKHKKHKEPKTLFQRVRKVLIIVGIVLLCLIAPLVIAELLLRIPHPTKAVSQSYIEKYTQMVHRERIPPSGKMMGKSVSPFLPPFRTYSNRESDNKEHLAMIYKEVQLEPNVVWESFDFLQEHSRKDLTAYTININSLGFRGPERSIGKPANTYRVIVLGSYGALGYGVEEDETYEAQLEKKLSAMHPTKNIEVWNKGRAASTAIVGLAFMENELFKYDPDLVILDYGPVDLAAAGDSGTLDSFFSTSRPELRWSRLWAKISSAYYWNVIRVKDKDYFLDTMKQMITRAEAEGANVLIVGGYGASIHPQEFGISSSTPFVSVVGTFLNSPPEYPDASTWKEAPWNATWLAELDPERVDPKANFMFYPYLLNVFQLNPTGYELLAAELARVIDAEFLSK